MKFGGLQTSPFIGAIQSIQWYFVPASILSPIERFHIYIYMYIDGIILMVKCLQKDIQKDMFCWYNPKQNHILLVQSTKQNTFVGEIYMFSVCSLIRHG